ncbi:hypothetical protein CK203_054878 [Vitis vinifera]|uniref:Reverse transcriptase zinc-binding domain-containing protein n=1 Tax=Vitis vinifera TaxID=29760 RepID=A0A438GAV1_VITVI|nr:hypothetical protein CK203_054878 [Vitis vinifera]
MEMDEVENLLLWEEWEGVVVDVGDRVRWGESKDDTFSVKAPYKALELESTGCFPMKIIWNSCVTKSKFLCLGSNMGKISNLGPSLEEGWALANKCYLCQVHEESIDHLLLHYKKTREVWKLFFSLFGVH